MRRDGKPKLVKRRSPPPTGVACVTRVYSSLAVIDVTNGRFVPREKLPSLSVGERQAHTDAELVLSDAVAGRVAPEL